MLAVKTVAKGMWVTLRYLIETLRIIIRSFLRFSEFSIAYKSSKKYLLFFNCKRQAFIILGILCCLENFIDSFMKVL